MDKHLKQIIDTSTEIRSQLKDDPNKAQDTMLFHAAALFDAYQKFQTSYQSMFSKNKADQYEVLDLQTKTIETFDKFEDVLNCVLTRDAVATRHGRWWKFDGVMYLDEEGTRGTSNPNIASKIAICVPASHSICAKTFKNNPFDRDDKYKFNFPKKDTGDEAPSNNDDAKTSLYNLIERKTAEMRLTKTVVDLKERATVRRLTETDDPDPLSVFLVDDGISIMMRYNRPLKIACVFQTVMDPENNYRCWSCKYKDKYLGDASLWVDNDDKRFMLEGLIKVLEDVEPDSKVVSYNKYVVEASNFGPYWTNPEHLELINRIRHLTSSKHLVVGYCLRPEKSGCSGFIVPAKYKHMVENMINNLK